jgi:hypothetical protein
MICCWVPPDPLLGFDGFTGLTSDAERGPFSAGDGRAGRHGEGDSGIFWHIAFVLYVYYYHAASTPSLTQSTRPLTPYRDSSCRSIHQTSEGLYLPSTAINLVPISIRPRRRN